MSAVILRQSVLARQGKFAVHLDGLNQRDIRGLAYFWLGKTLANKLRRDECQAALIAAIQDRAEFPQRLRKLPEQERQVLAIFVRHGGAVSGPLLECEMLARGLRPKDTEQRYSYSYSSRDDLVISLGGKFLLATADGRAYNHGYWSYSNRHRYPDLVLQPLALEFIEPAQPLPWTSSAPPPAPDATFRRTPAQVALDLLSIAHALAAGGAWQMTKGGTLAKQVQNRLRKLMPDPAHDPLAPPAFESLLYEILGALGAIDRGSSGPAVKLVPLQNHLRQAPLVQCWQLARGWLHAGHWQDGTGPVSERPSSHTESDTLLHTREILAWALGRVAHGPNNWLDLETFLIDFHSVIAANAVTVLWSDFTWTPKFASAQDKEKGPVGPERSRKYWLDHEGVWAANAILGTLFSLGLVERGQWGPGSAVRPCFRLTPEGRAVFGAPEVPFAEPPREDRFLTVQPNYEVTVYLDAADVRLVWPMAQIARRTSATAGVVQTFTLSRESVYQALESGLALDEIRGFLTDHNKTGLPANVARSLEEWSQRRESLVIRTHVSVALYPPGAGNPFVNYAAARTIGDSAVLLPEAALPGHKDFLIVDHNKAPRPNCEVDEDGLIHTTHDVDSATLVQLSRLADPRGPDWQLTAGSVRRARQGGMKADDILHWLALRVPNDLPALVETAVRNWLQPAGVVLDNLLMLQVPDPAACAALLASRRFQAFLHGHLPPDWFIVRAGERAELKKFLAELGFSMSGFGTGTRTSPDAIGAEAAPPLQGRRKRSREKSPVQRSEGAEQDSPGQRP